MKAPTDKYRPVGILVLLFSLFLFSINYSGMPSSVTVISTTSADLDTVSAIDADKLHGLGFTGSSITIGVVDTGIDFEHPELNGKKVAAENFVTIENGYEEDANTVHDVDGHGTWVASIAAGSNLGIAPDAKLISAKIFHDDIQGNNDWSGEETYQAVVEGIDYCVNNSADVINLSFGQYYNLPDEDKQRAVNYAVERGVVVCVAAGNEGVGTVNSGSIGNPSTALQDISVAATSLDGSSLASFSSVGPRSDWTMKPDISAPGIDIIGARLNGGTRAASGTSGASPIVAGAAALLIDALKDTGKSYTPSLIKAALMAGSKDMGYATWKQGAGFINVSKSWELLQNAPLIDNIPKLFYIHPQKLPFSPIDTLFQGQQLYFNTTIISPDEYYYEVQIDSQIASFVYMKDFTADMTAQIPTFFDIPENISVGNYKGNIHLNGTHKITIDIEIKAPKAKILFDEAHNLFTHYKYYPRDAFGETTFLYGYFREFWNKLTQFGYLVEPNFEPLDNISYLLQYDLVVLANPASYRFDALTDWLDASEGSIPFTSQEISTLEDYVKNQGKNIMLLTQSPETTNYTILNSLTDRFGISVNQETSVNIGLASINADYYSGVFLHQGVTLTIEPFVSELATHDGKTVGAVATYPSQGNFMVITSSYWCTNFGLTSYEPYHDDNARFLLYTTTLLTPYKLNVLTPVPVQYSTNSLPIQFSYISLNVENVIVILNGTVIEITNNSELPINSIGTYNLTIIGTHLEDNITYKDTVIFYVSDIITSTSNSSPNNSTAGLSGWWPLLLVMGIMATLVILWYLQKAQ